jgi:hypothetical protein
LLKLVSCINANFARFTLQLAESLLWQLGGGPWCGHL